MEAKVTWEGRMTFTGTADTGFDIPLDADPSVGGDNDGFRPLELMAISLAGCTAMDVISILRKKRQQIADFEVQAHVEKAEDHPHIFTHVVIEYFVSGDEVDEKAVVRSIELSSTRYCPAQAMLDQVVPIELKYHIYQDKGNGERTLTASGVYEA
ncbi:MAG: OsmC family protein [Anaerolineales bacterium]